MCLEHLDRKTIKSTAKILTYSGSGKLIDGYNFLLVLPHKHLAFPRSAGLNIQKLMLMDRQRTEMIPKAVLAVLQQTGGECGNPSAYWGSQPLTSVHLARAGFAIAYCRFEASNS